jgi:hypothetical protein
MSASTDANIGGYKLDESMSLSTAYTYVGFLDVGTYVPITEITVSAFDIVLGQPRQAPSPTFAPSNAFGGMSDIWFNYTSNSLMFTVDDSGLCTPSAYVAADTYKIENKITSIQGSAAVNIIRLPRHNPQNKTKWCWAAAAKMVGKYNYRHDVLDNGEAVLVDETGRHSYGGVKFFGQRPNRLAPLDPQYTVDAGQRQIVVAVHSDDRNEGGDNDAKETGLELASSYMMLAGTFGDSTGLVDAEILLMNGELANDRWVIANVFTNSGWSGHSVVITSMSNNGITDVYTYWDPWTDDTDTFTYEDITNKEIRLPWDANNERTLAWIQYCR